MKINKNHDITYLFRVINIAEQRAKLWQEVIPHAEYCKWKHGRGQIVTIELTDEKTCKVIRSFLKKSPETGEFGIWISLVTEYDHDGLSVPQYIRDFIRAVDGTLDFSFVLV